MQSRRIGSLDVSLVGLGCNNFGSRTDYDASVAVVDAAMDAGITFFDTADVYGRTQSEEFLGRALAGRRQRVVLATKFGRYWDASREPVNAESVRTALHESLRRLRTDYVDLYQLHRPLGRLPIADTLGALDALVREGKVREIGCSFFSVAQLRRARSAAGAGSRFVSVQNEYSLVHREPEHGVLDECARQGLAFLPFFPLASGLLTGKFRQGAAPPPGTRLADERDGRFLNDKRLATAQRLADFAVARGHSPLELAMSWLVQHRVVASVIAGATSPQQVRANAVAADWRLTDTEMADVDRIAPRSRRGPLRRAAHWLLGLSFLGACTTAAPVPVQRAEDHRAALLHPDQAEWQAHAPGTFLARVETSRGTFDVEVHRDWAPIGVDRFYNLARLGFFDDSRFFRVVPGFIAQFGVPGDPAITAVWKDRTLPDDPPHGISNTRGTVAYAMPGPNARSTQVFVSLADNSRLDAQGFVPFGRVRDGMDVVDSLYSGYGETATGGIRAGRQGRLLAEGNAHLDAEFPRLDRLLRIEVRGLP